jgi:microsomal epoxide hydrolase
MTAIHDFRIHVPEGVLDDLRARLVNARWPEQVGPDWQYGTPLAYLRELCAYWADGFDWRAQETRLNAFAQFTTDIEGESLHFIHQRSPEPGAKPLLLSHGWPGSVTEFMHVIGPLTNPRAHGGDPADAFHVVAPSIPGYGFSQASREPGLDARGVARRFSALMARLGYDRYFAQGGDWGSAISTWIGVDDTAHCAAIHLNLVFVARPREGDPMEGVSEAEMQRAQARGAYMAEETGYQAIQSTKPQTLGYGLNDSPVGLASWIVEKFHGWTQHDGDHEQAVTRDDILTNITVYWATQTITSSTRLYYENRHSGNKYPQRIETPTCVALFPGELALPPRRWVEKQYNLVHWREQARGGHFAALESPALLVDDVRMAFRPLRWR